MNFLNISPLYRVICIYNGNSPIKNFNQFFDMPEYLHMHIIDETLVAHSNIQNSEGEAGVLYQWGIMEDKKKRTRSPIVTNDIVKKYGCIGLGSAAQGGREEDKKYIGGGEGFIYKNLSYRINKNNQAFLMSSADQYWIAQTTAFKDSFQSGKIKYANSRQELLNQFLNITKNPHLPFLATFKARFNLDSLIVRSNGIYHDDKNADNTLYYNQIIGGHVIGDSRSVGDLESLENRKAKVELFVEGSTDIEIFKKIKIANKNYPEQFDEFYM